MQVPAKTYYSSEEYLELEAAAEYRSEYLDGQIIPMAGGKPNHNKISLNLSSALNFALRKTSYDVFMSDLRLWIADYRLYTYPDVMVVQTPLVFAENRQDTIINPLAIAQRRRSLIAEILSDSTEKYDRGDKFRMYRTIPSFKEYLLVNQTAMQVEKFTKNDANQWVLSEYAGKNAQVNFDFFEFEILLDELYEGVDLG
jgi:Uma2 family endonuclease